MSVCLLSQMKAGYRHLADFQGGLFPEQGEELSALTARLRVIVRHAVEAHGGTVKAESTPNERTIFRITLPNATTGEGSPS